MLRQYGLIMNIDDDGANNLSNSTLRRKLFNADNNMFSDAEEDSQLPSSSDEEDETGLFKISLTSRLYNICTFKNALY